MLKSYRFWLAIGVSLFFLGLFFSRMDLGETWEKLGEADYFLLVPAILVYFVAVYFRTLRWQYLLSPVKTLAVTKLYPVVVVGYMANNLLPVRLGEVVRAYYLGEREKVSKVSVLATIVVERVVDGLTLLFLAAVVSLFLPLVGLLQGLGEKAGIPWMLLALAMSMPFVLTAVSMVLVSSSPRWVEALVDRITGILPDPVSSKVRGLVHLFIDGLAVLQNPRRLLVVLLLSLPVWLLEAAMYYLLAFSFSLDQVFNPVEMAGVILLVTSVANLATSIPAAGGGIGAFEVGAAATLTLLGTEANTAGAYTIVVHTALLVPVTLLGLVYLWMDKMSLGQLARESRAQSGPVSCTNTAPGTPLKAEDLS
ncbi:MAG: lysylphosphatidylglycerol synthase transmembrane domain-containing protein [Dehalococcoidia bacterium]|nr:lysylphosphatidylglycerol synthase transmembrane domain-containing protein [Dehalococcoidia bacterium]